MSSSRGQIALRYILIPADRSNQVLERIAKVENIRLSCDAAYFIPALLRDGPTGFNNSNNWNLILPFPTFNECQKDNVPLFFFKRSENRDKQENVRAKCLLDTFSDKLSKRQNTFYGDVLVFWRRNVDETRHQMKLSDFTLTDLTRFLGSKVNPTNSGEGSTDISNQQTVQTTNQQQLVNGDKQHEESVTRINSSVKPTSEIHSSLLNENKNKINQQFGKELMDDYKTSSVSADLTSLNNPNSPKGEFESVPISKQFSLPSPSHFPTDSKRLEFDQRKISDLDVVIGPTPHLLPSIMSGHRLPSDQNPQPGDDLFFNPSFVNLTTVESSNVLRRFFESISRQLPIATSAVDSLSSGYSAAAAVAAASGNEQQLMELSKMMTDSEAKERRLQSEILKLTAELSQLTALNNSLGRKYQTIHQDLIGTQSSAQGYRDDASRLVREVTLLRDELVVLRERNQRLESELRSAGRIPTEGPLVTVLPSMTGSPSNQPSSIGPASRRPLHHVKGNSAGNATTNPVTGSPNLCDPSARVDGQQLKASSSNSPSMGWNDSTSRASPISGRRFMVTQIYSPSDGAAQEQFANLNEGEIVTVDREDNSGWWWVSNGRPSGSGWYPFSFLKPVQGQS